MLVSLPIHNRLLWLVVMLSLLIIPACGNPGSSNRSLQEAIIGRWEANLGESIIGDVREAIEFYEDGTVTSNSNLTSFVGDYKFIADDTIRVDWKEQGAFGHTPIQILKVRVLENKLILTEQDNKSIEYVRSTVEVESSPTSDQQITGKWHEQQQPGKQTRIGLEFFKDGTITSSDLTPGRESEPPIKGKYQIIGNDQIEIEWIDPPIGKRVLQFSIPEGKLVVTENQESTTFIRVK